MRIVLLEDVPKVGQKYDIVNVADGYARNFLIARGVAKFATPDMVRRADEHRRALEETRAKQKEALRKALGEVGGKTITVSAKADEKGNLFAGIGADEIQVLLDENGFGAIPAELIRLEKPVKTAGEHEITVRNDGGEEWRFVLKVEKA